MPVVPIEIEIWALNESKSRIKAQIARLGEWANSLFGSFIRGALAGDCSDPFSEVAVLGAIIPSVRGIFAAGELFKMNQNTNSNRPPERACEKCLFTVRVWLLCAWLAFSGRQQLADNFVHIGFVSQLFRYDFLDDVRLDRLVLGRRVLLDRNQLLVLSIKKRTIDFIFPTRRLKGRTICPFPTSMTALTWC